MFENLQTHILKNVLRGTCCKLQVKAMNHFYSLYQVGSTNYQFNMVLFDIFMISEP